MVRSCVGRESWDTRLEIAWVSFLRITPFWKAVTRRVRRLTALSETLRRCATYSGRLGTTAAFVFGAFLPSVFRVNWPPVDLPLLTRPWFFGVYPFAAMVRSPLTITIGHAFAHSNQFKHIVPNITIGA